MSNLCSKYNQDFQFGLLPPLTATLNGSFHFRAALTHANHTCGGLLFERMCDLASAAYNRKEFGEEPSLLSASQEARLRALSAP
jgi:hypothetical protein